MKVFMQKNRIEVELKFWVDDHQKIQDAFPGPWSLTQVEEDTYYKHPSRDFVANDEWFRIRKEYRICDVVVPVYNLVYKGPLLSGSTKSRQEIDIPTESEMINILKVLGFEPLITVKKTRRSYHCPEYPYMTITLDDVEGLGKFVEIEALMDRDQEEVGARHVHNMANRLGLEIPELRGYAKLLLEQAVS